jgi:C4-dicarboxylate transporter, DctQ subunit
MQKQYGFSGMKIFDIILKRFEEVIIAGGIMTIAAISIVNAIARNFFNFSLMWGEEVSQSLIVMITFIGVGYAARKGRHIRMSAFYDLLKKRYKKIAIVFISIVTSGCLLYLAYLSYRYAMKIKLTESVTPILRVPSYTILLWVPFGFVIAGIEFLLAVYTNIIREEVYLSCEVLDEYAKE